MLYKLKRKKIVKTNFLSLPYDCVNEITSFFRKPSTIINLLSSCKELYEFYHSSTMRWMTHRIVFYVNNSISRLFEGDDLPRCRFPFVLALSVECVITAKDFLLLFPNIKVLSFFVKGKTEFSCVESVPTSIKELSLGNIAKGKLLRYPSLKGVKKLSLVDLERDIPVIKPTDFKGFTNLEHICVIDDDFTRMEYSLLDVLRTIPSLRSIELKRCSSWQSRDIPDIPTFKMPNVNKIDVESTDIPSSCFSWFPNLEVFKYCCMKKKKKKTVDLNFTDGKHYETDDSMFLHTPKLKHLVLFYSGFRQSGFQNLNGLESIDLIGNEFLSNGLFEILAASNCIQSLKKIGIRIGNSGTWDASNRFTYDCLNFWKMFPIEEITLRILAIFSQGKNPKPELFLRKLREINTLKTLRVKGRYLTKLDVIGCAKAIKSLQVLHIPQHFGASVTYPIDVKKIVKDLKESTFELYVGTSKIGKYNPEMKIEEILSRNSKAIGKQKRNRL